MKLKIIFAIFFILIKAISSSQFDDSQWKTESIELEVPEDPEEFTPSASSRIINGSPSANGQFPFAAFMRIVRNSVVSNCGGSLIASTWILSSRTCFLDASNTPATSGQAFLGNVDRDSAAMTNSFVNWAVWITDPGGDHPNIIIFRLANTIPTTANIRPVRLPRLSDEHSGFDRQDILIMGWGQMANGTPARFQQFANFRILQVHLCQWNRNFSPNDFCSQHPTLGAMIAPGDEGGGAVMTENDGVHTLVGITSLTLSYPNGVAAVNLRVSSFLRFINQHTGIPFR